MKKSKFYGSTNRICDQANGNWFVRTGNVRYRGEGQVQRSLDHCL